MILVNFPFPFQPHVLPKKIKKDQPLPKEKQSDNAHPRQISRKHLTKKQKEHNLEMLLKKLKSKEWKKTKESREVLKTNQEIKPTESCSKKGEIEKVKEKRKPGRPGKKKINI